MGARSEVIQAANNVSAITQELNKTVPDTLIRVEGLLVVGVGALLLIATIMLADLIMGVIDDT